MTNFWSCHIIVKRKLFDAHRHVLDVIDVDFFQWGGVSPLF